MHIQDTIFNFTTEGNIDLSQEIQILSKEKIKIHHHQKIIEVLSIYLKILMGRDITIDENDKISHHLGEHSKKLKY